MPDSDEPAFRDPRTQPLPRTDAFRDYMRHGWGPRAPHLSLAPGAGRAAAAHRQRLSDMQPGTPTVVAAGTAPRRSNDVPYDFRPHSDFVWLTGCDAMGAVLILDGAGGARLFVPEPAGPTSEGFYADTHRGELWHGPVPGLDDWARELAIEVLPDTKLDRALDALAPTAVAAGAVDPRLTRFRRSGTVERALSSARRVKDHWEIEQLQLAVDLTVAGFEAIASELDTAALFGGERWLQATFERSARVLGNGTGYTTIVGAGGNAAILHWKRADGPVTAGDLVLVDAGVETRSLYTADLTRTLPAGGTFDPDQRAVYDHVLSAHRAAMARVRPGSTFAAMRATAYEAIATGLRELGILTVSVDEALSAEGQQHRRYIASGTGHHIGLDVHDCARMDDPTYLHDPLEPGMVLAVEPGMYFQANDLTVPPGLRGFGVRIEDNLLVTPDGHSVMSRALPTTADEVQQWLGEARSTPAAAAEMRAWQKLHGGD